MPITAVPELRYADPAVEAPKRRQARSDQTRKAYAFVAPALVLYVLFLVVPLVLTALLSVVKWNGFNVAQIEFNGLDNYLRMAQDPVFLKSLWINFVIVVIGTVAKVVISLVLAIFLSTKLRFTRLYQGVFVVPVVVSLVVSGTVFSLAFNPTLGFVNPFLESIGLGAFAGDWLGDPSRALLSVIVVEVWSSFGIYMIILMGGIAGVPEEIRQAARVDGAGIWREHTLVVIPMLKPVLGIVTLLAVIETLKIFGVIFVMTRGGPAHATEVLSTWGYFQAFSSNNVGYGAAIMMVLLIATFLIAWLQVRWNRRVTDELY